MTWEDYATLTEGPAVYAFENQRIVTADERDTRSARYPGTRTQRRRGHALVHALRARRRKRMHDQRLNIRLPGELAEALEKLARAEGITGSQWIREQIARAAGIAAPKGNAPKAERKQ